MASSQVPNSVDVMAPDYTYPFLRPFYFGDSRSVVPLPHHLLPRRIPSPGEATGLLGEAADAFTDHYEHRMAGMEKQYWGIKREHMDVILFFKKGKFYELYDNDACIAAREFGLKMTISGGGSENSSPLAATLPDGVAMSASIGNRGRGMRLAGIPESSFYHYCRAFVARGYKVGRVEQMAAATDAGETEEDSPTRPAAVPAPRSKGSPRGSAGPKESKIAPRELLQIVTAGTYVDLSAASASGCCDDEALGQSPGDAAARGGTFILALAPAVDSSSEALSIDTIAVDLTRNLFTRVTCTSASQGLVAVIDDLIGQVSSVMLRVQPTEIVVASGPATAESCSLSQGPLEDLKTRLRMFLINQLEEGTDTGFSIEEVTEKELESYVSARKNGTESGGRSSATQILGAYLHSLRFDTYYDIDKFLSRCSSDDKDADCEVELSALGLEARDPRCTLNAAALRSLEVLCGSRRTAAASEEVETGATSEHSEGQTRAISSGSRCCSIYHMLLTRAPLFVSRGTWRRVRSTATPAGARTLRDFLLRPLANPICIYNRQIAITRDILAREGLDDAATALNAPALQGITPEGLYPLWRSLAMAAGSVSSGSTTSAAPIPQRLVAIFDPLTAVRLAINIAGRSSDTPPINTAVIEVLRATHEANVRSVVSPVAVVSAPSKGPRGSAPGNASPSIHVIFERDLDKVWQRLAFIANDRTIGAVSYANPLVRYRGYLEHILAALAAMREILAVTFLFREKLLIERVMEGEQRRPFVAPHLKSTSLAAALSEGDSLLNSNLATPLVDELLTSIEESIPKTHTKACALLAKYMSHDAIETGDDENLRAELLACCKVAAPDTEAEASTALMNSFTASRQGDSFLTETADVILRCLFWPIFNSTALSAGSKRSDVCSLDFAPRGKEWCVVEVPIPLYDTWASSRALKGPQEFFPAAPLGPVVINGENVLLTGVTVPTHNGAVERSRNNKIVKVSLANTLIHFVSASATGGGAAGGAQHRTVPFSTIVSQVKSASTLQSNSQMLVLQDIARAAISDGMGALRRATESLAYIDTLCAIAGLLTTDAPSLKGSAAGLVTANWCLPRIKGLFHTPASFNTMSDFFALVRSRTIRLEDLRVEDPGGSSLSASDLYHPLVPGCTGNDIRLGDSVEQADRNYEASLMPASSSEVQDVRILLLTGPNMAGKSTLMRTVSVAMLLAQIGGPVPNYSVVAAVGQKRPREVDEKKATGAHHNFAVSFYPTRHIHTRIGASDTILLSMSTLMLEMREMASLARMLERDRRMLISTHNASEPGQFTARDCICTDGTKKGTFSIVSPECPESPYTLSVIDELGRGTSTFDGCSIADATIRYLAGMVGVRPGSRAAKIQTPLVLFSTHYHNIAFALKRDVEEAAHLHKHRPPIDIAYMDYALYVRRPRKKAEVESAPGFHVISPENSLSSLYEASNSLLGQPADDSSHKVSASRIPHIAFLYKLVLGNACTRSYGIEVAALLSGQEGDPNALLQLPVLLEAQKQSKMRMALTTVTTEVANLRRPSTQF